MTPTYSEVINRKLFFPSNNTFTNVAPLSTEATSKLLFLAPQLHEASNFNTKLAPNSLGAATKIMNFSPHSLGVFDNTPPSILAPLISEACQNNYYHISSNRTTINLSQSRTELDSHTDTCTVGKDALITHVHNRRVNIHSYDASLGC